MYLKHSSIERNVKENRRATMASYMHSAAISSLSSFRWTCRIRSALLAFNIPLIFLRSLPCFACTALSVMLFSSVAYVNNAVDGHPDLPGIAAYKNYAMQETAFRRSRCSVAGCSVGGLFSRLFELFYEQIRLKVSYLSEYFIACVIKHDHCGFSRYAESRELV